MKKVLYLQYTNPAAYPPLEHSSQLLARDSWQVLFLGVRSSATAGLKFQPETSIQVRLLEDCAGGWRQKLHYLKFALWAVYWAFRWRPQWVYASDLFSSPAGLLLSFLPGIRVVYHEHDLHAPEQPSLFVRLCQRFRKSLARKAEMCIVPNEVRSELFKREHPLANVVCVWNCPTLDEISVPRTLDEKDDFWLLYHGSVVPVRLPSTVIQSLKRLPESVKLRVIGYEPPGHEGYMSELHDHAKALGVAERVHFCKSVAERKDLLAWSKCSNVGLAFVPTDTNDVNMKNMTGASNKPFDYLANGVALLVTNVPDWSGMFVNPGYGIACDPYDVDDLVAAIRRLHDQPQHTSAMGERGRKRIVSEWNYECQFAPVLSSMNCSSACAPIRLEQTNASETVS